MMRKVLVFFLHLTCLYGTASSFKAVGNTTLTRTLSKNIIFRCCNNFVTTPCRSEWKVCINIAGVKLPRIVCLFEGKISRGYYMAARRREISLRVLKNIS